MIYLLSVSSMCQGFKIVIKLALSLFPHPHVFPSSEQQLTWGNMEQQKMEKYIS